MSVGADIQNHTIKILEAVERAASEEADILLTPEGSLSGYTDQFDQPEVVSALDKVTASASEKGLGLALGTCFFEPDGNCYNQIRFYLPTGEYLGFHSKTLRCGSWDSPPTGEINHYSATDLRTFQWNIRLDLGGLICNDMWANPQCTSMPDPHLSQQLASMGARVLFQAVNGGRNGSEWSKVAWQYHESNLRMRARASKLWIVTVDNCHPTNIPCSTPSGVIDTEGNWVCRTEATGEQFFVYAIEV